MGEVFQQELELLGGEQAPPVSGPEGALVRTVGIRGCVGPLFHEMAILSIGGRCGKRGAGRLLWNTLPVTGPSSLSALLQIGFDLGTIRSVGEELQVGSQVRRLPFGVTEKGVDLRAVLVAPGILGVDREGPLEIG